MKHKRIPVNKESTPSLASFYASFFFILCVEMIQVVAKAKLALEIKVQTSYIQTWTRNVQTREIKLNGLFFLP